MNREIFLDSFGHIADAPGGIDKLRNMVLDLAVRGQLGTQDDADVPAIVLLSRIAEDQARLVAAGVVRKAKDLGPVAETEKTFLVPPGWSWTRFGNLFSRVGAGSTPAGGAKAYVEVGVMFLRSQNVQNDGLVLDGVAHIPRAVHERMPGTWVQGGDILLNITGASIGRAAIVPTHGWTTANVNQHVSVLRPLARETTEYLHALIVSPYFQNLIAASSPGASREGLAIKRMAVFPVPLPPEAEQRRIVERVKELTGLCSELEQQQTERAEARSALTASALNRVSGRESAGGLHEAIRAFADNIGLHLAPGEGDLAALNRLRQTILNLAVRGRLTSGDPSDEPVEELLKRAALDRQRLVSERKIRGSALVPQAYLGGKDGPIPLRWARVLLGGLGAWGSGATPSRSNGAYYGGTIPWLKSGELNDGYVATSEETITELALRETSVRLRQRGDVLIAMYGATTGRTAILDIEATTNQAVCACQPYEGVDNEFLHLLLMAMRPQFVAQGAGGAQPNISKEKIEAQVVALPPQAEQVRIVERVHELMTICDDLERQLLAARLLRRNLSASIAAHAASEPSAHHDSRAALVVGLARPNDAVRSFCDATQLGDLRGKTAIESSALRARSANPAAD